MRDVTENCSVKPDTDKDPLTTLLRKGAKDLINQAVEAALELWLEKHKDIVLSDGRNAVVRNSYLPERTIQTGIGDVTVKIPKVRHCSHSDIKLNWF